MDVYRVPTTQETVAFRENRQEVGSMRTLRLVLVLALATGLVVAGFLPAVLDVSAQPAKKVIKFGVNRGAENLDPVTQDANPDIWAFMQIYQQLVRVNVKGDGFEPDLAEKWTTSADGRTWTFMLRKDAKFSTGDPVTAADAVWSLKRARDTKGPWKWALEAVEDIAAKDDHTVVISLKEPWAPFLADISLFSNSILSEKAFKGASADVISNKPVGSGPFMLAEWKKGEVLIMKANPHYHEKGVPKTASCTSGTSRTTTPGSSRSNRARWTASTTRRSPAWRS